MLDAILNIGIRVVSWVLSKLINLRYKDHFSTSGQLRDKQVVFLANVAKLITYSRTLPGYELTAGELYRTKEQQAIYLSKGLTKVKISQHQKRLAVDLNLFIDGEYRTDKKAFSPLAIYWKLLHPDNRSGYFWNWDYNHFEMI